MFERLKRLYRKVSAGLDDGRRAGRGSFDVDNPPPQRSNPDPPKDDDWFARVRERSHRAAAAREARALDAADARDPQLGADASRMADALLAKIRPS